MLAGQFSVGLAAPWPVPRPRRPTGLLRHSQLSRQLRQQLPVLWLQRPLDHWPQPSRGPSISPQQPEGTSKTHTPTNQSKVQWNKMGKSIQLPTRILETLIPEFTIIPEKRPTTGLFIYWIPETLIPESFLDTFGDGFDVCYSHGVFLLTIFCKFHKVNCWNSHSYSLSVRF